MKLYYSPNACSLGIHFLLHEIGQNFEIEAVDFSSAAQYKPPYVSINPKSKVPLLGLDNGEYLSEFPAIAFYLAETFPGAALLPATTIGQARALELLDYLIATIHMRGFTRIFRPGVFSPTATDVEAVQQAGRDIITKGFTILEPVLGEQEFILGKFSIVEGALFFLEHWCRFRANIPLPANFEAHLDRLLARPAAKRTLAAEGLA
jgi:glutathione S-transferase